MLEGREWGRFYGMPPVGSAPVRTPMVSWEVLGGHGELRSLESPLPLTMYQGSV